MYIFKDVEYEDPWILTDGDVKTLTELRNKKFTAIIENQRIKYDKEFFSEKIKCKWIKISTRNGIKALLNQRLKYTMGLRNNSSYISDFDVIVPEFA